MTSVLESLRAQKAQRDAEKARPSGQQIKPQDIDLRGKGIMTKREAEKNQRAYERETAKSLKANPSLFVNDAEKKFQEGIDATVAAMREAQKTSSIVLDDSQLHAVAGITHNKVSVLIGAAGTGKTTVTSIVVKELAKHVATISLDDTKFVTIAPPGEKAYRLIMKEARLKNLTAFIKNSTVDLQETMPGIAFGAYTGRATQQLRRALPKDWHKSVSTIHSLLGYAPEYEEYETFDPITRLDIVKTRRIFRPSFNESCKLPYQVYVLDEASMIPIPLFNELIAAIHPTSRILLIGDIHQLPPVYGKSVLGYAMKKWPVFELTTLHRQAEGSGIIANAHRVLKGKPLENSSDFHIIGNVGKNQSPGGQGALQTYVLKVVKQLNSMKDKDGNPRFDPYKDALIVPQNKSMVGQEELNSHLVTMFNPEVKENGVIVNKRIHIHTGTGNAYFAIRDKVMITANINDTEPPITNGMIGIVESININGKYDMKRSQVDFDVDDIGGEIDLDMDAMKFALNSTDDDKESDKKDQTEDQRQASHVVTIKFENGQSYSASTAGDYRKLQHGYAFTCHKAQGGEYPNVIILCHSVNNVMLTQEWLYTAITRARQNVYLICNQRGLDQALSRQTIKGNTLAEKIKSYIIETKSDDDGNDVFDREKFPILWNPEKM